MVAVEELDQIASSATAIRIAVAGMVISIPIVSYLGYRYAGKIAPLAHQIVLAWVTKTPQIDGVGPIAP